MVNQIKFVNVNQFNATINKIKLIKRVTPHLHMYVTNCMGGE